MKNKVRIIFYLILLFVVFNILKEKQIYRMFYQKNIKTNKEFNRYIHIFEKLTNKKVKSIINFNKLKSPRIGVCYPRKLLSNNNLNEIDIDLEYWRNSDEYQKFVLISHELIHCTCKVYVHKKGKFKDGCDISIMNDSMPSSYCIEKHLKSYLKEFRGFCGNI